jgi:transglutaminase-like putative cysteine protease
MHGSVCALLALVLLANQPTMAQAPRITSDGDPSVRADTIYQLAVDSRLHPDESVVLLLDDGVVRFETDGTGSRTYRQVAQILSSDAVAEYAEHEFSFTPAHQLLTINWIRVVRPDGTVVSETPTQVQEADVPAPLIDPVYSDTKVRRYSLSGVVPGTIIDWSYTVQELKPFIPGDFTADWSVHTGRLTRRSRYLVDLPATLKPHLVERNLTFKRRESVSRGRRTYLWATQDVPRLEPEDFMADSSGVFMSIGLAGPLTWEAIGAWYADLSRDRYTLDLGLRHKIRSLLPDTRTAEDTLRAVQRWVAQDIRYVSIALGLGGYQPRFPREVVSTGYGDCKDKATLFIAAARYLGFRAYPVLLNSGGRVERALPSLTQFNHAIAVVERSEGRIYADLTADLVPFGELPDSDQGQFGVIVYADGTSEQVILPSAPPSANLNQTRMVGTLFPDGYLNASYEEVGLGSRQYSLRSLFLKPADAAYRGDFARSIATSLYPGAEADSLQIFDGRDLTAEPRVALRITRGFAARPTANGSTFILNLPLTSMRSMADAARALEAKGQRRFPIDAGKVVGPVTTATEISLTLPQGWQAQLPADVEVTGKWGTYRARYDQEGTTLRVSRTLEGARGVYPPDDLPDLTRWLRDVAQDDVSYLVLEPAPTP